jgi:hypothetical protein
MHGEDACEINCRESDSPRALITERKRQTRIEDRSEISEFLVGLHKLNDTASKFAGTRLLPFR